MVKGKPGLIVRVLKWGGIIIGSLILLLFLLPYLFPGFVSSKIRQLAHHSIKTEFTFSTARLSFFRHFPSLTLTLYDVHLKGSAPYADEELVDAKEISFGVNLSSIFSEVDIDKIYLTNAFINIQADAAGHPNYDVYISKKTKPSSKPADSSDASLKIQKIIIENSKVVYNDRSIPMLIDARGFNYQGSGDLSKDVFDLTTHMQIDTIDFNYDSVSYFASKKLKANLITRINTNSLDFEFQQNDLHINELPVQFTGRLAFMKEGYDMDFKLRSADSDLHDLFTALPPDMLGWLTHTEIKGSGDIDASLTGKYIASTNTMPDVNFNMKIRNGYISNNKAPVPLSNLFLNFQSRLPGLNADSLRVNIDSVFFNLDKGYFSAVINSKGLKTPWIFARVRSSMELAALHSALGLASYDLKGRLDCRLDAEGQYATSIVRKKTLRKTTVDTVIASIPHFAFSSSLTDGYLKYRSKPEAIRNINFTLNAACPDADYRHLRISLDTLNATMLSSYIHGNFHLSDAASFPIDANLETVFHLSDIAKVYPLEKDSISVGGDLSVNVHSKGHYLPSHHQFPVTRAELHLTNGFLKTKYYPHPLENIQVSATVTNTDGDIKNLDVALTPVSFLFEGEPFMVKADLKDFDNLLYDVRSRGTLDIGKISRVFGLKDYQVTGLIATDLSLRGRETDAKSGHYERLFNQGTMKMEEVKVASEQFPLPFYVHTGLFRFSQDKMWFDTFKASYGKTNFTLDGWLTDVIGYMTKKGALLHGNFNLKSDDIVVDQLMAFAGKTTSAHDSASSSSTVVTKPQAGHDSTGVILVPGNLAVALHARVGKVHYNGLEIDDFKGGVSIDSGIVRLDTTTFILIGAPIEMNAAYASQSPRGATFNYHLNAKNFDVHRAFTEVSLFHDLASSAANAEGIVSLDYTLSGGLDANMRPLYPSLKGGGTIVLSNVKVKGMKLFGAVSKETSKDVNDPDLSGVHVTSTIADNIITIQRTRMKVSLFHLRMEGQTSFDGRLNLHVRVGLPPFGIIGIPVTVIGSEEKPEIKLRRSKTGDILTDTDKSESLSSP